MGNHSNLTEEDMEKAARKYPLADLPLVKVFIPTLFLSILLFLIGALGVLN